MLGRLGPRRSAACRPYGATSSSMPGGRGACGPGAVENGAASKLPVPVLLAAWKAGSPGLRMQILSGLAPTPTISISSCRYFCSSAADADPLVATLSGSRLDLRRSALAAAPVLARLLDHPDITIRREAITQVGRLGRRRKDRVAALTQSAEGRSWDMRFRAAQACRRFAGSLMAWPASWKPWKGRHRGATPGSQHTTDANQAADERDAASVAHGAGGARPANAAAGRRKTLELEKQAAIVLPVLQEALESQGVINAFARRQATCASWGEWGGSEAGPGRLARSSEAQRCREPQCAAADSGPLRSGHHSRSGPSDHGRQDARSRRCRPDERWAASANRLCLRLSPCSTIKRRACAGPLSMRWR